MTKKRPEAPSYRITCFTIYIFTHHPRDREINAAPEIIGNTVVVLEQNAVLRLGVEALLESWGCHVISGEYIEHILADIKENSLRPTVMLLPPMNGEQTGDQLARHFEAELGYPLPWIGVTGDLSLIQRWKAGAFGGILLEMPCTPTTLQAAFIKALQQKR